MVMKMVRPQRLLIAALVLGASTMTAPAFAQTAPGDPASRAVQPTGSAAASGSIVPAPVDSSYVLGFGDTVEVSLVGRADFGSRARVSTDGTILLPLIGKMVASERTVIELSEDVRQALIKGGFYADPIVRADVVSISSRYVTVLGAVGSPGLLPLDRNYRLSEILARVGGGTGDSADYILLTKPGATAAQRYYIAKLAAGGIGEDPLVQSGDKIFIPSGQDEVFYISGQVNTPGQFPITNGLTFRMALAKGGGVTENGSEKKLKVVRDGKPLKKAKLDDVVKVGDIITIGERLF
jgi:polysaccharide export outer membrane protein